MYISLLRKAFAAIIVIILLGGFIRIYFRSKNVTKNHLSTIFRSTKYIQAWILAVTLLFTCCFGLINHIRSKQSSYAVISLNYSEASQALNSNGTRYNMAEITCDEVIEKAIEKGAFENVTANDLKKCISVYPYVQGDVGDESQYHISTEFVIEYHASQKTQHLDAENVIKLITSAYKEYYVAKYTDNFKLYEKGEKPDYSRMEYMDIVSYFDKEAAEILNYLYGMAEKGSSFVSKDNATFNSVAGKVFQFKQTQIEQNLKSLVLQKGIVRNKAEYIDRLSYQNTNTDFDRRKNAISFDLCNQAISMYSEEMTRVVLVPTWDESGKYYMGRTKVGIDELSVKATGFSNSVASNEKEILDNNLIINKMENSAGDAAAYEAADTLVTDIDNSIDSFTREAIAIGREYSNYKMNQCIAVSISGNSLVGEAKTDIVFALLAYAAVLIWSVSKKIPKEPENYRED